MAKRGNVVKLNGGGYQASRNNATRHGILSRVATLPWESAAEFDALLSELTAEYAPAGPTERHLVETLASIMWRQARVIQAEGAEMRRGLLEAVQPGFGVTSKTIPRALVHSGGTSSERLIDALDGDDTTDAEERADLDASRSARRRALDLLAAGGTYEEALSVLTADDSDLWESLVARDPDDERGSFEPTATSLESYLRDDSVEREYRRDLEKRPLIRTQAFGEAMNAARLVNLTRYETALDRKLERTVGMLLKLAELRRVPPL